MAYSETARLRAALPAIAAATVVTLLPLGLWGYPRTAHDFSFHLDSWIEVAYQWSAGTILPRWPVFGNYGCGDVRFIFYPPLAQMWGAALSLVLPWRIVPGAFVASALIVAGVSMFLLAREWMPSRYAVLAAVVYMTNPYQLLDVYWRWAAAELLVSALFPLLFLFALRLGNGDRRAIVLLALLFAGVWLCDAPAAVIVSYSLAALFSVLAIYRHDWRMLLYGAAALALGLALAAFYVLPAAWEQRWLPEAIQHSLDPIYRPQHNFVSLFPERNKRATAMAIVNLVLAAVIGVTAIRRRCQLAALWWSALVLAAMAAVLMLRISSPLWNLLPKLQFVQFPWRWLFVLNTAAVLLLAAVLATSRARTRAMVTTFAAVLFCVFMGIVRITDGEPGKVNAMRAAVQREGGYEGWLDTIQCGPTQHAASAAANEDSGPAHTLVRQRGPELALFEAHAAAASAVRLPLAWHPAWRADVNGITASPREDAGEVSVEVAAGANVVRLRFVRTWDRTLGGLISVLAVVLVAVFLLRSRAGTGSSSAARNPPARPASGRRD